jgi:hypothetical protein
MMLPLRLALVVLIGVRRAAPLAYLAEACLRLQRENSYDSVQGQLVGNTNLDIRQRLKIRSCHLPYPNVRFQYGGASTCLLRGFNQCVADVFLGDFRGRGNMHASHGMLLLAVLPALQPKLAEDGLAVSVPLQGKDGDVPNPLRNRQQGFSTALVTHLPWRL